MTVQDETPKIEASPPPKPKANNKRLWLIGSAILLAAVLVFSSVQIAGGIAANNAKQAEEAAAQAAKTAEDERMKWFVKQVYKAAEVSLEGEVSTKLTDLCETLNKNYRRIGRDLLCKVTGMNSPEENQFTIRFPYPGADSPPQAYSEASNTLRVWGPFTEKLCEVLRDERTAQGDENPGADYSLMMAKADGAEIISNTCDKESVERKAQEASQLSQLQIVNNVMSDSYDQP